MAVTVSQVLIHQCEHRPQGLHQPQTQVLRQAQTGTPHRPPALVLQQPDSQPAASPHLSLPGSPLSTLDRCPQGGSREWIRMAGCILSITWKREQRGNALNPCPLAGSVVSTRWGGSTLLITSLEPPHGSAPQWRQCVTMSSGSTNAASYRAPCSSSIRGLFSGYKIRFQPLRIRNLILLGLCHMDGRREQTRMGEFILYITQRGQHSGKTHEHRG